MDSYRRAPQGARGLKTMYIWGNLLVTCRRAPQGARGLKRIARSASTTPEKTSCPARGTWIENENRAFEIWTGGGRAPQGARGLKKAPIRRGLLPLRRRAPQGARGLKNLFPPPDKIVKKSCPARGTWIEKCASNPRRQKKPASCPARGTWIENAAIIDTGVHVERRAPQGARGLKIEQAKAIRAATQTSCPARGTWIENGSNADLGIKRASCPARGTWIENFVRFFPHTQSPSCPARGTWIENRSACR